MKRFLLFLLVFFLFIPFATACAGEKHSVQIWGAFDTVITFIATTDTSEEFDEAAAFVEKEMQRLHRIFDAYHSYEDVNNLFSMNENASKAPFFPENELLNLLLLVDTWRADYSDRTDPTLGRVLSLWHDAREDGTFIPSEESLREAALHTGRDKMLISDGAVSYLDPELRIDLGAVAKGYSAGLVAEELRAKGFNSFILNAGGNVVVGSAPTDGRSAWQIGVENIDGQSIRLVLAANDLCVVTSGDYQRYFEVGGIRYHHLIDPDTLFPGSLMHAVTVLTDDSGLGDFLSTALFLTPYEEGRKLVDSIPGVEALWTLQDGSVYATEGFAAFIKN